MIFLIVIVLVALSISYTCSLLEACLLSLSSADIASISEKNATAGNIWRKFREHLERPISVILIVNTLAHTIGATVSGAQFQATFGTQWLLVYSLVFSYVMIQWTEIWPKSWGVRFNRRVALYMAVPMNLAVTALRPIVSFCELMNRPFEGKRKPGAGAEMLNDINLLTRYAHLNHLITQEQQDIVSRSITLSQMRVTDIMIERANMKFLSTAMSMMDGMIEAHIHHHTRYPLIHGQDADRIVGYVNVKDIISAMRLNPKNPSLEGIARPIVIVQRDELVTSLLKKLTKGYQHMAVVVDEAGLTVGLVTLEDITEALLGDLQDEYDRLPTYVYSLCEGRVLAGGGVTMNDLRTRSGMDLPSDDRLLNDWLLAKLPSVPKVDMKVRDGDHTFIVRKLKRSNIYETIVEKNQVICPPATSPAASPKAETDDSPAAETRA